MIVPTEAVQKLSSGTGVRLREGRRWGGGSIIGRIFGASEKLVTLNVEGERRGRNWQTFYREEVEREEAEEALRETKKVRAGRNRSEKENKSLGQPSSHREKKGKERE